MIPEEERIEDREGKIERERERERDNGICSRNHALLKLMILFAVVVVVVQSDGRNSQLFPNFR